ncbi:MAG: glycosyltransferase [Anaerolineae bacterium]|nr:glycosyltransferase [Anaerolineae bacterium]
MSRLLFVTAQLPYPPHQGGAIRTLGLIKGLAERGHRITLLSLIEEGQPDWQSTPLADLCDRVVTVPAPSRTSPERLRDLLTGRVDMERRLWSPAFLEALLMLLGDRPFDGIHFEGIEVAGYLNQIHDQVRENFPGTILVYDAFNAEYDLQRRIARQDLQIIHRLPMALYSVIQARRLERFERQVCQMSDHVIAVSEADGRLLTALESRTPVTVVPNAIDAAGYETGDGDVAAIEHPALVFTGKMDYRPNVDAVLWFADSVLPLIRKAIPDAHFTVVGQKPHTRLDQLRGRSDITLTGWVDSVQPYVRAADVFVIPMRMGSGTRLKLLEAMAMRRAIVSTRLGAEGVAGEESDFMLLADDPQSFANAVIGLLGDSERCRSLGEKAAVYARQHYDWPVIVPRIESLYIKSHQPSP